MPEKPIELAISVSYKQDAWNLVEFIEYHRIVGVQHFYICNNDDNTYLSDAVLRPYTEEGLVHNIHTAKKWPYGPTINRQALAHNFVLQKVRGRVKWLAMLDMDEFIFPMTANDVKEVLRDYEQYPSLAVSYACFGSSGLKRRPFLQTESYVYRAHDNWEWNKLTKAIGQVDKVLNCVHHHKFNVNRKFGYPVDENKRKCGWWKKYSGNIIRINHYMARSKEDFLGKMKRGNPIGDRRDWSWFRWADQNKVYDDSMKRFVPALREAIMKRKELLARSRRKIYLL